jgi:hypothetical protein
MRSAATNDTQASLASLIGQYGSNVIGQPDALHALPRLIAGGGFVDFTSDN